MKQANTEHLKKFLGEPATQNFGSHNGMCYLVEQNYLKQVWEATDT